MTYAYENLVEEQLGNSGETINLFGISSIPEFVRNGYTLVGWEVVYEDCQEPNSYSLEADFIVPVGVAVIYPEWSPNPSFITFKYGNFEKEYESKTDEEFEMPNPYIDFETFTLADDFVGFEKEGYFISVWSTDENPTEDSEYYVPLSTYIVPAEGVVFYPNWSPKEVKIQFEDGEGTKIDVLSSTDAQLELLGSDAFTKDGFTFLGWNSAQNYEGDFFEFNQIFTVPYSPTPIVFYAEFSQNVMNTYNSNSDGSEPSEISFPSYSGEQFSLQLASIFSRTGYTLSGWNSQPNGDGQPYELGQIFTSSSEDSDFYAVWTPNEQTISYDYPGTDGYKQSAVTDQLIMLYNSEDANFERFGYEHVGWNSREDGQGENYDFSSDYTVKDGGMTLYPTWAALPAKVRFNFEGSEPFEEDSFTDEQRFTAPADKFTKEGSVFLEWNTKSDGSGISYDAEASYTVPAGGIDFYAIWAIQLFVTYDANYEGADPMQVQVQSAECQTFNLEGIALFSREGYSLVGWNSMADGSGDFYEMESEYTTTVEDMTFYAVWEETSTVLSLGKDFDLTQMRSYPNPVNRMLTVERNNMQGNVRIRVMNSVGKVVMSDQYLNSNNTFQLDFSSVGSGIYFVFVEISDDNGNIERERVMKK